MITHTHTQIKMMDDSMPNKRKYASTQNVVDMTAAVKTPESQVPFTDQKSQFVVVSSDDMDISRTSALYVGPSHATTTIRAIRCDRLYVEPLYGNLGSVVESDENYGTIRVEMEGVGVSEFNFTTLVAAKDNEHTNYMFQWNSKGNHTNVGQYGFDDRLGVNFFQMFRDSLRNAAGFGLSNSVEVSLNSPKDGRLRISTGDALKRIRIVSPHAICGTRGYTTTQLSDSTFNPFSDTWLSPHNPSVSSISMCHLTLSGFTENTKVAHHGTLINTLATVVIADSYLRSIEKGPFPTVQLGTTRRYPGDLRLQLVTCKQTPLPGNTRWIAHLTLFE